MPNTPRYKPCPDCGQIFDTCRRYRKCTECSSHPTLGGPRAPGKLQAAPDGWLYFIGESGLCQYVKIGFTKYDPVIRLRQLQTGNPRTLMLLYSSQVVDVAQAEARTHKEFADDRVGGEWFWLSPRLRTYLLALRNGEPLFD